jgi:hypothetical protein
VSRLLLLPHGFRHAPLRLRPTPSNPRWIQCDRVRICHPPKSTQSICRVGAHHRPWAAPCRRPLSTRRGQWDLVVIVAPSHVVMPPRTCRTGSQGHDPTCKLCRGGKAAGHYTSFAYSATEAKVSTAENPLPLPLLVLSVAPDIG